jgi:hypothetical protein
VSTRHAFHVLGLDRRGVLRRVRVGTHRIAIERGGITFSITNQGAA